MAMEHFSAHGATEKGHYVREMFARIAPRYDAANRILTGGMDERWRQRAIALLRPGRGATVIDLCCGTGDIAFHLLRSDRSLRVVGVDFCEPMLRRAKERALREARGPVEFVEADVMALPFSAASFDGATMGFSLRNVVDIAATLREIGRVLRAGARFVNLDVSKPRPGLLKLGFDFYFYRAVPLLGALVGGSRAAYTYLPNSLTNHPDARTLVELFGQAGFKDTGYVPLMGGTIAIHYGTAP